MIEPNRRFVPKQIKRLFAVAALLLAPCGWAAEPDPLSRCTAIPDPAERLSCYDKAAAEPKAVEVDEGRDEDECQAGYTALARLWNTRPKCGSKLYQFLPYKQNYLIARYSSDPNSEPTSAKFGPARDQQLNSTELKFQVSLKVKVAEQMGGVADLWFGYTQQSNWQAFNGTNARPFRQSNYEPELVLGFPLHTEDSVLGFTPRMINFGLDHQSSGQSDPFERSWNRAYVQFGVDRDIDKNPDRFAMVVRAWYRIPEGQAEDDNPDIVHYLGYGDVLLFWRHGDSNLSALVRNNLQQQNNRGSIQLDWSIPITHRPNLDSIEGGRQSGRELRFYVQFFTGYGETLIDYNHYQTTIGIGLMLSDWL
jgi:phospholipase A1